MFADQTDEEVIASVTRVAGVGRWSDMPLICGLRPDVLPVGDPHRQGGATGVWPAEAAEARTPSIGEPWRRIARWPWYLAVGQGAPPSGP